MVVEHNDSCGAAGRSLDVSGVLIGHWKCELEGNAAEALLLLMMCATINR
jgi:hypothetical protein